MKTINMLYKKVKHYLQDRVIKLIMERPIRGRLNILGVYF
jgi:hypothetical protein